MINFFQRNSSATRNPFEDSALETDKRSSRTRGASFSKETKEMTKRHPQELVEGNWVVWKKSREGVAGYLAGVHDVLSCLE